MTSYKLIDFQDGTFANLEAEDLQAKKDSYPLAVDQPWYYMDASLSNKNIEKLNTLFAQIGYSDDEYDKDNAQVDVSTVRRPEFNVSVYYTITDEGSLDVTVPVSEIYYHEDYQLESIEFLNYMLDYDNTYDGYFLLPGRTTHIRPIHRGTHHRWYFRQRRAGPVSDRGGHVCLWQPGRNGDHPVGAASPFPGGI